MAILCLTALLLSASSIHYFYWVEEQLHEQTIFAKMEAGAMEQHALSKKLPTIQLVLKDKEILPQGYTWEEEGREFSYKGMFYDIISLKKTANSWVLTAASDEEEALMVANQSTHKKGWLQYKLASIQLIFVTTVLYQYNDIPKESKQLLGKYNYSLKNIFILSFSPPPEAI